MPRSGPTTLALPPFSGATRRILLILLGVFFADALLSLILPKAIYLGLFSHLIFSPSDLVHGQIWQPFTYLFLPMGITGTLFALLTIWFVASLLEDARGERWVFELFFASAIGGALIAAAISLTHLFGLTPDSSTVGCYAGIFGLLVAVALLLGDTEFLLLFIIRIRVKYLVAIYVLVDLATLLKSSNAFEALLHLSGALCGFLFVRFATRRGLSYSVTERYYAMRNDFYRARRRRAARKFEVYMSKQGRDVHFDKDGHYVDPDKDPTDKRWMN